MAGKVSVHPLETYLAECRAVRATGANVAESSYYSALAAQRLKKAMTERVFG
jgi:hypothetical protein